MTTDIASDHAYGLVRPLVADLHACIIDACGGDPQLWSQLCEAAHVCPDTDDQAALAELVAVALRTTTGPVRVAVASLNIRLQAHTALTTR
ncbi:hypothetical protein [Actinoplanes sp. NPDC049802]|uniref:hypothetical protein n=1 Tax=Actinoplanes sp. NPDC049802 TaxID=3154742 RepID=UPI0033D764D4